MKGQTDWYSCGKVKIFTLFVYVYPPGSVIVELLSWMQEVMGSIPGWVIPDFKNRSNGFPSFALGIVGLAILLTCQCHDTWTNSTW